MPNALLKRVVSAVILVPIFVGIVVAGPPWVFQLVVVIVGAAAAWELARLFARGGHGSSPGLTAAAGAAVTGSFAVPGAPVSVLTLVVGVMLAAGLWREGPPASGPALVGVFTVGYVNWLLGHALLLQQLPGGEGLILFLVGVTWAGESAAFAVGSLVGRHRLAPRVSPGKTVEGALAQVVVSVAAAVLLSGLAPGLTTVHAAGAGMLLGIVGQGGDLAESLIKRSVGVKDAGQIIPGHGGLLDRLDGLLFNTPALVYYLGLAGVRA